MMTYFTKKHSIRLLSALCFFALVQINPAYSQDLNILQSISSCQQIDDLSFRLACYDRLFPPGTPISATSSTSSSTSPRASTNAPSTAVPVNNNPVSAPPVVPAPAPARTTTIFQPQQETSTMVQIVEVEKTDLRNSRLVTSDGTVFLQTNATTITRWPQTPFNVEVQRSLTGTIFLVLPRNQRIRVAIPE